MGEGSKCGDQEGSEGRPLLKGRSSANSVWGTLAAGQPVRLSTSCAWLSPVMAAEQFLPPDKLGAASVVDTTLGRHLTRTAYGPGA